MDGRTGSHKTGSHRPWYSQEIRDRPVRKESEGSRSPSTGPAGHAEGAPNKYIRTGIMKPEEEEHKRQRGDGRLAHLSVGDRMGDGLQINIYEKKRRLFHSSLEAQTKGKKGTCS